MPKRIFTIGLAAFVVTSLTGLTIAAANTIGTKPARAVVSHDGRVRDAHEAADDHGRDTPTTTPTGATTVTTIDDHGVDNPASHDVGDDHGVGDDRGVDATTASPVTTVDDHGGATSDGAGSGRGPSGGTTSQSGQSGRG